MALRALTTIGRGCLVVILRLAYLGVTNALAMLRLLPMSDRAKDVEILALRHQIMVLQRQLHGAKARFTPTDPAFLAALLHRLPRAALPRIRLLVRPETVLRWHRDLIARHHARIWPPEAGWPAANGAVHPHGGAAPGAGEQRLGLPAYPR
jgi:hypothetical protein